MGYLPYQLVPDFWTIKSTKFQKGLTVILYDKEIPELGNLQKIQVVHAFSIQYTHLFFVQMSMYK